MNTFLSALLVQEIEKQITESQMNETWLFSRKVLQFDGGNMPVI